MKKLLLFLAVASIEIACIIASSCNKPNTDVQIVDNEYESFLSMFSDSTAYAFENVGDTKVLFVSHETYGNEKSLNAIAAEIYGKDSAGKIVCYGEVRSQGTLYPVSMLDGKIVTAGHHYINKYTIDGSPLSLSIIEDAEATYDTAGKATYSYENRDTNEYLNNCSKVKYDSLMQQFEKSVPVEFHMVKK